MPAASNRYFGSYLIQHHGISAIDIYSALERQRGLVPALESLSNKDNCIDTLVSEKLKMQLYSRKSFEAIALELGLLSEVDISGLTDQQAKHHTKLGNVLVEMGVLTEESKKRLLNDYRNWLDASAAYGKAISNYRR